MKAVQLIELESMRDLLHVSKHFLFRMQFGVIYIYYSGVTSDTFIGMDLLITKTKYSGYLKLDSDGNVKEMNKIDLGNPKNAMVIAIIPVKEDSLLRGYLANFLINKYGINESMIKKSVEKVNEIIKEKVSKNVK